MTAAIEQGSPARVLALIGIFIALGLPQLGLGRWLAPGDAIGDVLARESIWWAIGGLVILWIVAVERRPLASIGIRRPTWATLGWGIAGTIALMASVMLSFAVILPTLGLAQNMEQTGAIADLPLWLMTATLIRAGVIEEILYRGYPIERIEELTGSVWLAALIPGAVFILAHLPSWGAAQLIVVTSGTIIMTALYVWRRDLICVMIAHAATDLIGFTLARAQM